MEEGIVLKKEYIRDYEAGSASIHIPILGSLFPKLFRQDMKPTNKWFLIVQNKEGNYKYQVSEALYNEISSGDRILVSTDKYGMPKLTKIS